MSAAFEKTQLSRIASKGRPIVYGIVQAGDHVADGVPYIRSTDVGGNIDVSALLRTSPEIASKYSRASVNPGDIVFSLRGNIGESSIVPNDLAGANLTQGTARISVNENFCSRYIRYALRREDVHRRVLAVAKGSTFHEITLEDLRKIEVPTPPLPQQEKIAAILGSWDEALDKLDSLIAAKKRRKQGLMQQLLTAKHRLPGYSKPWAQCTFGQFLSESRIEGSDGLTAQKITVKLYGRGVLAKQERMVGSSNTKYFVRRAGQFIYSKLDFLNGAFGIIPPELDGYESTLDLPAFDVNPSADARWLLAFLVRPEFYEKQVGAAAGGRIARRVNPPEFLKLRLKAPDIAEQRAIADVLYTADMEVRLLYDQRAAIDLQKRGLMQQLLTGKVRTS